MIATEEGLTFAKEGAAWRCLEIPGLWMLPGSAYAIRGVTGEFFIPTAIGLNLSQGPISEPAPTRPSQVRIAGLTSARSIRHPSSQSFTDRDRRSGLEAHSLADRRRLPRPCRDMKGPTAPQAASHTTSTD